MYPRISLQRDNVAISEGIYTVVRKRAYLISTTASTSWRASEAGNGSGLYIELCVIGQENDHHPDLYPVCALNATTI